MEHSGTTLLSDLLRQTGTIESGFEVGVLLADSPRKFEGISPFYENMLAGWSISREQLEHCCDVDSFGEFYERLKSESPLIEANIDLFDKTPRYATEVRKVFDKTEAPIIYIYKDPRASVFSDFKRADTDEFDPWFEDYVPRKKSYMRRCYNGYIEGNEIDEKFICFSLEDLCFATRATAEKLYDAVREPFQTSHLVLQNLRYKNTRKHFVSADVVLEYRMALEPNQISKIESEFSEFQDWFYD